MERRWVHSPWLLLVGTAFTALLGGYLLSLGSPSSPTAASPLPAPCAGLLAQGLAQRGLPGAVTADDGVLHADLTYPLPEGANPEQGAQAIWEVFEAATDLPAACPFARLVVVVRSGDLRLRAEATAQDLRAWAQGVLDDEGLIDRVRYTRDR